MICLGSTTPLQFDNFVGVNSKNEYFERYDLRACHQ